MLPTSPPLPPPISWYQITNRPQPSSARAAAKKPDQSSDLEPVLNLHDAHGRAALLAVLCPILLAEVDGVASVDRTALARHRKVCRRVPFYRLQPPDENPFVFSLQF